MKRIFGVLIVVFFMLVLLTGCTNTEYGVQVNEDGSGKVEYKIQLDESIIEDQIKELSMDTKSQELIAAAEPLNNIIETAKENGYDIEEIIEEDVVVGYKATKEFDDITQFKIQDSVGNDYVDVIEDTGIQIEKENGKIIYKQSATINVDKAGDIINTVKVSYKFPKGSVESNADEVEDKDTANTTLTWNLGKRETKKIEYTITSFTEPEKQEKNFNTIIIIAIIAIIILVACIGIAIFFIKRHKK